MNKDFITTDVDSGNRNKVISVTAAKNTSGARATTLTITTGGGLSRQVSISQEAGIIDYSIKLGVDVFNKFTGVRVDEPSTSDISFHLAKDSVMATVNSNSIAQEVKLDNTIEQVEISAYTMYAEDNTVNYTLYSEDISSIASDHQMLFSAIVQQPEWSKSGNSITLQGGKLILSFRNNDDVQFTSNAIIEYRLKDSTGKIVYVGQFELAFMHWMNA